MTKIQIILGSTRPGRNGKAVADWVYEIARQRNNIEVELVDVADFDLPLLDEPYPPTMAQYTKDHTKQWAEKIAEADGYIFVAAEYNHSIAGALKNAIDYLYGEWNNKSAGFVSYGSAGGARAVEHLRGVMAELQIADVREQLMFSLMNDFESFSVFRPNEFHEQQLNKVLDQVVSWAEALKSVRVGLAYAS